MSLASLTATFPWAHYSKKLSARIESPRNCGVFTRDDAQARGVRLAEGLDGSVEEGNCVAMSWLVDLENGVILDARFQVFGSSALIGAADTACDLLVGKNYDQASRFTTDLVDMQLRDRSEEPAFPREMLPQISLVVNAILEAAESCAGVPLAAGYASSPMPQQGSGSLQGGGYAGWDDLPHDRKVAVVEEVLDREIRPYIALDAGGVDVVELTPQRELIVAYKGSCTSCYSSVGSTLAYIQQMLRAKVHGDIVVIPNYDTPPTGMPPGFAPGF